MLLVPLTFLISFITVAMICVIATSVLFLMTITNDYCIDSRLGADDGFSFPGGRRIGSLVAETGGLTLICEELRIPNDEY